MNDDMTADRLAELLEEVTACDPPFCAEIAAELRANRARLLRALGGEPAYYVQVDFDTQFVETASHVEVEDDLWHFPAVPVVEETK